MKNINSILYILFPNRCISCKTIIAETDFLCNNCYHQLENVKYKKHISNKIALYNVLNTEHFESLFAYYKNSPIQSLLKTIKYKNRPELGLEIMNLFNISETLEKFSDIDFVVPVPLHPSKEKSRGYNQVDLFANKISQQLNAEYYKDYLIRTHNNSSQTKKNKTERILSSQNLFIQNSKYQIDKGHFLIIDDVITTGATINSCIKALQTHPEIKVSVLSIACVL